MFCLQCKNEAQKSVSGETAKGSDFHLWCIMHFFRFFMCTCGDKQTSGRDPETTYQMSLNGYLACLQENVHKRQLVRLCKRSVWRLDLQAI